MIMIPKERQKSGSSGNEQPFHVAMLLLLLRHAESDTLSKDKDVSHLRIG